MVDINKKYRTRSGLDVQILCTDRVSMDGLPVVGMVLTPEGRIWFWEADGSSPTLRTNDLIEVSPYEGWKIDDPVWVRDGAGLWVRRHFAGVNKRGLPMAWINGCTSWSTTSKVDWDEARLASEFTPEPGTFDE